MELFRHMSVFVVALLILVVYFEACEGAETTTEQEIIEGLVVKNSTSVVEAGGSSSGATCSCDNSESPVCASNGVTYKNSCRFECSKKRVKRLRVVKNGRCAGLSLNQYRGAPTRPTTKAPPNLDSIFSSFFSNKS